MWHKSLFQHCWLLEQSLCALQQAKQIGSRSDFITFGLFITIIIHNDTFKCWKNKHCHWPIVSLSYLWHFQRLMLRVQHQKHQKAKIMTNTNRKHFTDTTDHGTSGYSFQDDAKLYIEKILQSQASVTLELIYPSHPWKTASHKEIHHHKHQPHEGKLLMCP